MPRMSNLNHAVRWSRYAPDGARGMGVARAHRYGFGVTEYLASANDQTVVVVQAESAEAVRNIDSIARVPGLDAPRAGRHRGDPHGADASDATPRPAI